MPVFEGDKLNKLLFIQLKIHVYIIGCPCMKVYEGE